MSDTLDVSELQQIHEEMCLAWSIDPRRDVRDVTERWMGDKRPPWDPIWNDFMVELPYDMHIIPIYQLLFPRLSVLSFNDMIYIPLTADHIKAVKREIDRLSEESVYGEPDSGEYGEPDSGDEEFEDDIYQYIYTEEELDEELARIHNLEPRALFQDEPGPTHQEHMECCRRGLSIIEESMESGEAINEGQYIELANIFKRLSV
jgi:hypothetical protein